MECSRKQVQAIGRAWLALETALECVIGDDATAEVQAALTELESNFPEESRGALFDRPPGPVVAFEVEEHGLDHAQYFQGAGIALTEFLDIGTGVGHTPREALEDALESLAQVGWTFSDAQESELAASLGEDADKDYVTEARDDAIESELPAMEYVARLSSYTGCSPIPERFSEESEARTWIASFLRQQRAAEYHCSILERGKKWEVQEPMDCALIPDDCGVLSLSDNSDERDAAREHMEEMDDCELHYYVSVRVR